MSASPGTATAASSHVRQCRAGRGACTTSSTPWISTRRRKRLQARHRAAAEAPQGAGRPSIRRSSSKWPDATSRRIRASNSRWPSRRSSSPGTTPRAIVYRSINKIPDDLGTAVNVQSMAFGNMGDDSATGVVFTRNPNTGDKEFYGEYLPNAQGEDVVAGIRTPHPDRHAKARDAGGLRAALSTPASCWRSTTATCRTSSSPSSGASSTCCSAGPASGPPAAIKIAVDLVQGGQDQQGAGGPAHRAAADR